ncbi:MAG: GNAT family N-acetyltransferase [Anaerostipes sp.]|nr:GNAT family N-acetyltransferase [Anaerostipes sp.]
MRMNQLQDEGAQEDFDLIPCLTEFYEKNLKNGRYVSWLAVYGKEIVATSGMSFTEKPPYYSNPSGKIGILSSMYTVKEFRRKGIARILLQKVMNEAESYGCGAVHVTASDMGVLLYSDYGFQKNKNFLQYIFT